MMNVTKSGIKATPEHTHDFKQLNQSLLGTNMYNMGEEPVSLSE